MAELAYADLQLKVERGEHVRTPIQAITFEAFAERYLTYAQTNKAKTTAIRDGYTIRIHLVPFFKTRLLETITPELIESYKTARRPVIQGSTLNRELGTLKNMFRKGVEWGYLAQNPAATVRKLREPQTHPRFLLHEDVIRLLHACRESSAPPWLYAFVVTGINAGLRKSELFHLQWGDVNFGQHLLVIRSKDGWHTKNYESRLIPMNPLLSEALAALPRHPSSPYVFCNPDGSRLHDVRGSFDAAVKRAGLPHTTFHSLRHTFASHLVMNGVDLATVQKLLGHRDIKTTMQYAHLAPEHLKQAVHQLRWDTTPADAISGTNRAMSSIV